MPSSVSAAVKLNKSKATMEVDSTIKLKISGTTSTISWKTSKKSVATVTSGGTVTAKAEGNATIAATVKGKKYSCKITVVDNGETSGNDLLDYISTLSEFEDYLNKEYASVTTDMGTIKIEHSIYDGNSELFPEDYSISSEWDGVSPYDIQYSNSYTQTEKDSVKKILRKVQECIYKDAISLFPSKKVAGGFIHSWYEYPSVRVGYKAIRFLSWCNFTDSGDIYAYKTSKIGEFKWLSIYDDYDFTK